MNQVPSNKDLLSPGANARGAATPGPKLDALVGAMMGVAPRQHFAKYHEKPLPGYSHPYSTDYGAMALVIDWMHAQGDYAAMSYQTGNKPDPTKLQWFASFRISGGWASANTLPAAVCLAALDGVQRLKDRRQS